MIRLPGLFAVIFLLSLQTPLWSQKIVYSEPDREDSRRMDFEIVGKINGNFLFYKNYRNKAYIAALNNDMQQVSKVEQDYLPNSDRLVKVEFFPYQDFAYMIFQYTKKNVVYCKAARIDGFGNRTGEIVDLDTAHIGGSDESKIYTIVSSDDKSKLAVFKINSRNKRLFLLTTLLFNDKLELLKRSAMEIPMEERNENLGEFSLDNEGDMVFSKFLRNYNDNISAASMVVKKAMADSLWYVPLNVEKNMLDEIQIKVDNANRRYMVTSYYYKEKRGNIEGMYFYVWDKDSRLTVMENTHVFSDQLRQEARGDASMKMAFNDYFIRQIITRKDGGFILAGEAYYTTSRFNNWSRWDYIYGTPGWNTRGLNSYYYNPFYSTRNFWGYRGNFQSVRYHADNIAVLSFNSKGELEWNAVMVKSQYDDESDDNLSFQIMNTGGQLHFLFNQFEKRANLLNDFSLTPKGELNRNPTLKNLDRGYEFLPKYGKQVSSRQMIIPCLYRNSICFAKLDYN